MDIVAADAVTCGELTTAVASVAVAESIAAVAPLSTGIVVERMSAGTLLSAVGDEQGVRLGSLGTGEAAPARLGLLPRLAADGDGEAFCALSAFAFFADLGEPVAAAPTFLFLPFALPSPFTDIGELSGLCDSAAADVLTVSAGFLSPFILLVCSLMKCSRQPQSNMRCRAARLLRQRYSKAEKVASLSSDGVGSEVVTLMDSTEGEEAEAETEEVERGEMADVAVAVEGATCETPLELVVTAVADDGEQHDKEQGVAEATEVGVAAAVLVTGALIQEADVTGMGVE